MNLKYQKRIKTQYQVSEIIIEKNMLIQDIVQIQKEVQKQYYIQKMIILKNQIQHIYI